jgi:hypothetical protein
MKVDILAKVRNQTRSLLKRTDTRRHDYVKRRRSGASCAAVQ